MNGQIRGETPKGGEKFSLGPAGGLESLLGKGNSVPESQVNRFKKALEGEKKDGNDHDQARLPGKNFEKIGAKNFSHSSPPAGKLPSHEKSGSMWVDNGGEKTDATPVGSRQGNGDAGKSNDGQKNGATEKKAELPFFRPNFWEGSGEEKSQPAMGSVGRNDGNGARMVAEFVPSAPRDGNQSKNVAHKDELSISGKQEDGNGEREVARPTSPHGQGDGKVRVDGTFIRDGSVDGSQKSAMEKGNLVGPAWTAGNREEEIRGLKIAVPRGREREEKREIHLSLDEKPESIPLVPLSAFAPAHVPIATVQSPLPSQVARDISRLATQLVDQVLIHEAALDGKQEIHVHLKGSALAGSQIQISKDGGTLKVVFSTPTGEMADLVKQQQHVLQDTLKEKLKLDQVTIQTESRQSSSQDQGEGRSRGQRNAYEEMRNRNEEEDL
jgi:type III secretion system needle length determinant